MEITEKTIKIYELKLTEGEVRDLRNILNNNLKEDSIGTWQRCTVESLKKMLEEIK